MATKGGKKKARGGKRVTIRKGGKPPITFRKGALHRALGIPEGEEIPEAKKQAALSGRLGPKIKRMAVFAFKGALAKGRKTVAGKSKASKSRSAKKGARKRR